MRGDSGYAYLPAGQAEIEFGKYQTHIRQLEHMNSTLAAEIDRMSPVVKAAINHRDTHGHAAPAMVKDRELWAAVANYESAKA